MFGKINKKHSVSHVSSWDKSDKYNNNEKPINKQINNCKSLV